MIPSIKLFIISTRVYTWLFIFSSIPLNLSICSWLQISINYPLYLCSYLTLFSTLVFSNLINSYYTKVHGVKEANSYRSMYLKASGETMLKYSKATFLFSFLSVFVVFYYHSFLVYLCALFYVSVLLFLAYSYSSPPFVFKYRSLGEFTACWAYSSFIYYVIMVQVPQRIFEYHHLLFNFGFVYLMFGLAFIHSNNHRDLITDKRLGVKNFSIIIGESSSILLYYFYMLFIYVYCFFLSTVYKNIYLNLPLLTIYSLFNIYNETKCGNYFEFDKKTLIHCSKVSLLLAIGVYIGSK
ncbi:hypothetical protein DLAC_03219 [Tieghemostelium lacteum]|uniref:UbiA prenyltransferase family protein n=1 Tax=Tieghemostelium lacteum TaxID=361077 RepID=A0A152A1D9_TIELA|nr:hypothetical protein DLAC_03219 [Tieghemostelium lacteum]|eukprot:KYR00073.1 hypothetical protein DLAC_03219 [Tieghemostelium lacteum]